MEKSKLSVFWFRRDLRLHDNHGLFKALKHSEKVLAIFIFDQNILNNLSATDRRVSLIYDQLTRLNDQLQKYGTKIHILHGDPNNVFKNLFKKCKIDAVFVNTDYEPYAVDRDLSIQNLCSTKRANFYSLKDQVIFEKDEILSGSGKPYNVYTPYMKKWLLNFRISLTIPYHSENLLDKLILNEDIEQISSLEAIGFEHQNVVLPVPKLNHMFVRNYEKSRDFLNTEGTCNISIHLRFGLMSVRELAKIAYQYSESLLKELIWRSFFCQILWHNPQVVNQSFKKKYDSLIWNDDAQSFLKWKHGQTGFPLVDAGMRELFDTGLMKNRVRMLTASFLVKNLGIDWRLGEAYFASKLLDYDLASNNGNWQWVAGTGSDAAPYFRVFNPITQQKKFDPDFVYCKKWLPEMDELGNYNVSKIVDLKHSRLKAIERYKVIG